MISARRCPFWISKSVTCASKRTSPPRRRISFLIFLMTSLRRSVPMCGLFSHRISSGAPNSTKVFNTNVFLPVASFTAVFSFPSEKVPAPPSPNWILLRSSSCPVCQNVSTISCLRSTSMPLSKRIGAKPVLARESAQKSPAGPMPITTGRCLNGIVPLCSGA